MARTKIKRLEEENKNLKSKNIIFFDYDNNYSTFLYFILQNQQRF